MSGTILSGFTSTLEPSAADQLPPLVLAYVGDAVYELYVRTSLAVTRAGSVRRLHREATSMVRAGSQKQFLDRLRPVLSDGEWDVVRRGRNAKGRSPKGATIEEYRYSTGFEALVGYLYLTGEHDRLTHLMRLILEEDGNSDG